MVRVRLPTLLRPAVGGAASVDIEGSTVGEVLRRIAADHPLLADAVFERDGSIRRFISVFIGDENIRYLQGLETPVADGEELIVLPAVAGGSDDTPASYGDMVQRAKVAITEIVPEDLALDDPPLVIDVRETYELARGMIPGARVVPRGMLEKVIDKLAPDPATEIVLYCDVGNRSALAALVLEDMGYRAVTSLAGGIDRWKAEGRPTAVPKEAATDSRARYSRHLSLPEVGAEGQERLGASRILIVGAGGLGSPAALYLAAAGVGTVGIVDYDVVDISNLQRQVIHDTVRIGMAKVDSAADTIRRLNPEVTVETHRVRLSSVNALQLLSGYDLVVDGADNFPTRYLLNDASLHMRVPVVHGSVLRFEGQATVFVPYAGPCYRCLFPEPPPPELAPSCAEAGVLGVVPGVIGTIQATEAIKVLLGIGDPLVGRLLAFDGAAAEFRLLNIRRDPACPACADEARPPQLVDYDDACRPVGSVTRSG
jgi:molybdopterin/thiamine biosynthesis adenylyltransferase/rhodanese-related sulfurtransferase/molybdopterin converting factor small subunit